MAKTKGKKAAGAKKPPARKGGAPKAPAEKAAKPKEAAPKADLPAAPNAVQAGKPAEPKVSQAELDALRKPVETAKGRLEKAQAEAKALADKARALVAEAKDAYRAALAPYRDACHKAGVACEYEGGRSANVSEKVSFLVEKTDLSAVPGTAQAGKGVRVCIKGRPETQEVIPLADLEASINKAAYAYTDKHVGPKEEVSNKGGSLSNRLRAVLQA
ncbi:MAG: hypothetical protein Fur0037_09480 [Planctomycetota bacterium]